MPAEWTGLSGLSEYASISISVQSPLGSVTGFSAGHPPFLGTIELPKVRIGNFLVCLDEEPGWSGSRVLKRDRLPPRLPASLEPRDIHDATIGSFHTSRDTTAAEGPQQMRMPAAISAMAVAQSGTTTRDWSELIS